jgi:hypothetical protein
MITSPPNKSDKRKRKLTPTSSNPTDPEKVVYKRPAITHEEDYVTMYGGDSWYLDYSKLCPNYQARQNKLSVTEEKLCLNLDHIPLVIQPPSEDYYSNVADQYTL